MNAVGHCPPDFECDTCDRYFGSEQAVNQHMNAMEHWAESSEFSESEEPELECDDCEDTFYDEDDLRDHETKKHFYCDPCDRYFQDYNSINQVFPVSPRLVPTTEANIHSICTVNSTAIPPSDALSATRRPEQLPAWLTT